MTLSWVTYQNTTEAIQYTGSNGTDVVDYIHSLNMSASESGGVITTSFIGFINTGDWLIRNHQNVTVVTNDVFTKYFAHINSEMTDVVGLGIASVPTLIGGAQTNVDVTIKPTYPDTNYQATAALSGAVNLLASLSILSVTVLSATTVRVVVRNTGLLSLAGALCVVNTIHN